MNTKEMKQPQSNTSFNEWTKHTQFGVLWAPTMDEVEFYQDHELRKEVYQEVKHLPKIDFEDKPFIDKIVEAIIDLLRLNK